MTTQPLSHPVLELIAQRFRALGEPARLRLLSILLGGERSVGELVEETGLGQANVSKHLQTLRAQDFVERRKEGLYAFYRICDPSVAELCRIMCGRLEEEMEERQSLLATLDS